jgi:hypothetical protein
MHIAAIAGDRKAVCRALQRDSKSLSTQDKAGNTPLLIDARHGPLISVTTSVTIRYLRRSRSTR